MFLIHELYSKNPAIVGQFFSTVLSHRDFFILSPTIRLSSFYLLHSHGKRTKQKHTELCFSFSVLPQLSHQPNGCKELMLIRVDFIVNSGNCVRKTQRI
jgi:hypothetical protein